MTLRERYGLGWLLFGPPAFMFLLWLLSPLVWHLWRLL